MLEWPQANEQYFNQAIENRMSRVLELREVVTKALEEARSKKVIGHSLGAWITIYAGPEWMELLKATAGLEKIFIVSRAELKPVAEAPAEALALEGVEGIRVMVQAAEGSKCERCWIIENSVGDDLKHPTLCQRCAEVVAQLQG